MASFHKACFCLLSVSAAALSATQSEANGGIATRPASSAVMSSFAAAAPAVASRTALPIEKGIYYADYSGSCAEATEVFFYDGTSYGYIIQSLPGNRMNSPRDAALDAHNISRTGASTRGSKDYEPELVGFTRIWSTDDFISEAGFPMDARGIKAGAAGGFIFREGSMSARRMEYSDTAYGKCAVSQLSPAMQATVRKYRPALANGAPPSGNATTNAQPKPTAGATSSTIPLQAGYYAYVEGTFSTCSKPVTTPMYFDGSRFWEESDVSDPKHEYSSQAVTWQMAGPGRFRIAYRTRDEDGRWEPSLAVNEYVLNGPQSFTFVGAVGGPLNSNEKYQLCSATQLPAKARWYKAAQ